MTDRQRSFQKLLCGVLSFVAAGTARAEEMQEVWVELPDCAQPPYDADQLSSSLALELSPYRLQARVQADAPAGGTHLRLLLASCDAETDSLLLRWETPGAPPRRRQLSLRDVPWPARARTLALLISEALRPSRWQESEALSPPSPTPSGSALSLAPVTADPFSDSGLPQRADPYPLPYPVYVAGDLHGSWVPRVGVLLYGIELGLHGRMLGPTEWSLEASYASGKGGSSKLGTAGYDLEWWSAAVGVDYNFASARRLQIGPRLSMARMAGNNEAISPANIDESLALLGGHVRLSPQLRSAPVSLDLVFDASYPLTSIATRDSSSAVPWTAWVVKMGAGLSIEL
ncbi:MAG: hypothetical protein RL685_7308 [Pseudomonadota bacterium]|jgi:hypothetical protein